MAIPKALSGINQRCTGIKSDVPQSLLIANLLRMLQRQIDFAVRRLLRLPDKYRNHDNTATNHGHLQCPRNCETHAFSMTPVTFPRLPFICWPANLMIEKSFFSSMAAAAIPVLRPTSADLTVKKIPTHTARPIRRGRRPRHPADIQSVVGHAGSLRGCRRHPPAPARRGLSLRAPSTPILHALRGESSQPQQTKGQWDA